MPHRKCCAANCGGIYHVFAFPKQQELRQKWVDFVQDQNPSFNIRKTSALCFRHFYPESFRNYYAYQQGSQSKLFIKSDREGPIPRIQIPEDGTRALSPRQQLRVHAVYGFPAHTLSARKRLVSEALQASEASGSETQLKKPAYTRNTHKTSLSHTPQEQGHAKLNILKQTSTVGIRAVTLPIGIPSKEFQAQVEHEPLEIPDDISQYIEENKPVGLIQLDLSLGSLSKGTTKSRARSQTQIETYCSVDELETRTGSTTVVSLEMTGKPVTQSPFPVAKNTSVSASRATQVFDDPQPLPSPEMLKQPVRSYAERRSILQQRSSGVGCKMEMNMSHKVFDDPQPLPSPEMIKQPVRSYAERRSILRQRSTVVGCKVAMNSPKNDFGEPAESNRRRKSTVTSPHVDMREETSLTVMVEDPAYDSAFHATKDEPLDIEIKLEPAEATTNIPGYSDIDGVVLHEKQWQEMPENVNHESSDSLIIKQEATDWPSSSSSIPESNMEPSTSNTLKGKGNLKSPSSDVQDFSECGVSGYKFITGGLANTAQAMRLFKCCACEYLTFNRKRMLDHNMVTHSAKSTSIEEKQGVCTQSAKDPNPQNHSQNDSRFRLTYAKIASTKSSSVNKSQTENPALDSEYVTKETNLEYVVEGATSCDNKGQHANDLVTNEITVRKKRVNYPIPVTSKETSDEGGWEDGLDNQALQLGFTRISLTNSKLIGYAIISSKSDGPDSKMELTRQVVYNIKTKSVTVTINDRVVPWDNKSPSETLKAVAQCKSCQGNTDLNIASAAVYSTGCTVILESTTQSTRCPPCLKERKAMQKRIIRSKEHSTSQVSRVDPSSKVQLKSLSKEELLTRSRNMRKEINSKTGNTTTGAKPKLRVSEQPTPKRARKPPKSLTL